jgi:DNA polymerase III delta prime subunit
MLLDAYHRENEALRLILLERGLTRAQIRRAVKRRVQSLEPFEEASVLLHRVCEEIQKRIQESDALQQLAKTLPRKDKKEMN